ncbi:head GIN domain-containing protein [Emticicia sp.]|uniref:head GIN domain-containing protein n=1 Tax=Emticicia sp. TaxID=1930953 RepID=UPI003752F63B
MKNLVFLLSFISVGSFAQDLKRTFNVSGFDKLDIGSSFIITVTQGNDFKVDVRGREQDVKEVMAKVSDNTLDLHYPSNWSGWKNHKEVYVTITMPKLTGVEFSGASKSNVSGFSSEKLAIQVSGASSATFNVNAKKLSLDCSGASGLKITGDGQALNVEISGASNINALDFKVANANIDASGASDAKVYVTSKIVVEASGASSVRYKGGASVTSSTSGAGSVKSMN